MRDVESIEEHVSIVHGAVAIFGPDISNDYPSKGLVCLLVTNSNDEGMGAVVL